MVFVRRMIREKYHLLKANLQSLMMSTNGLVNGIGLHIKLAIFGMLVELLEINKYICTEL